MHPRREIFPFQVIFRAVCGMCMYQFPLQLLIKDSYHSDNISSGLKNIFVHPGREIIQFQAIFRRVWKCVYVAFYNGLGI